MNMPRTVPNQKIIHINRDMPKKNEGNFLQIKKENMYAAYKVLNAHAFSLYLYLAANKDGFDLAFSPEAIHENMGMPVSTVRDQTKKLIDKGYLVPKHENSNVYDFFEKPVVNAETHDVQ